MATKLFLRNTTSNGITDTGDGVVYDLITTAGASADTGVVDTVGSGTNIQWTKTAGGLSMAWITGRVPSGGFTLTSADISAWLHESNNAANAKGRIRIYRYQPGTPTITELGGPFDDDAAELANSTREDTWTANVTDTAFAENDRILIRFFITNNGTMGANRTCTITFNAADAASGDSFINIAQTVAFKGEVKLLAAEGTSFAVSGTAASLERGYEVAAEATSFTFTGTAALLEYGHRVDAGAASFTFTGSDATLTYTSFDASRIEVSWVEFVLPPSAAASPILAADEGAFVFSGSAASLERSRVLTAEATSFAFTGTDASLERGYEVAAEAEAFTFSGAAATFLRTYVVTVEAGSFTFAGSAASLEVGRRIAVDAESFAFTGSDAALTVAVDRSLAADAGSFVFSGTDASLEHGYEIAVGATAFTFTGADASLLRNYVVIIDVGAFSFSGSNAALEHDYRIDAQPGSFAFTGSDANLTQLVVRTLSAGEGGFVVTGSAAALLRSYLLPVEPGSFVYSGSDADLIYTPGGVGGGEIPHSLPFLASMGSMTAR